MRRIALTIMLLVALATCLRAQTPQSASNFVDSDPANRADGKNRPDPTEGLFSTPGCCFLAPLYVSPLAEVYFTTEVVAFRRDWTKSQPIVTLNTPTNPVLSTHDVEFVSQPGLSLSGGRRLNDTFALEGGFLGLLKWDETRAVRNITLNSQGTLGNLFSPFTHFGNPAQVGLDFNTFASIQTVSEFNTAELNFRQRFDTRPSLMQASGLYGFRYINVHERFGYRTQSLSPPGGTNNAVDVETKNGLFGFQAGGTAEFRIEDRGWFNIEVKGLLCRNSASQQTDYTVGPIAGPTTSVNGGASGGRVALGADVALSIVWKFTPALVGRLGYQGIFIDGLASASDNFTRNAPFITTGTTEVYRNGHLAFHGPFAGLTMTW